MIDGRLQENADNLMIAAEEHLDRLGAFRDESAIPDRIAGVLKIPVALEFGVVDVGDNSNSFWIDRRHCFALGLMLLILCEIFGVSECCFCCVINEK